MCLTLSFNRGYHTVQASWVTQWWNKNKNPACHCKRCGFSPGPGRSSGGGNGNPPCILTWEIPWMQEPGGPSPWGPKESDRTEQLTTHITLPSRTGVPPSARVAHETHTWAFLPVGRSSALCFQSSSLLSALSPQAGAAADPLTQVLCALTPGDSCQPFPQLSWRPFLI